MCSGQGTHGTVSRHHWVNTTVGSAACCLFAGLFLVRVPPPPELPFPSGCAGSAVIAHPRFLAMNEGLPWVVFTDEGEFLTWEAAAGL